MGCSNFGVSTATSLPILTSAAACCCPCVDVTSPRGIAKEKVLTSTKLIEHEILSNPVLLGSSEWDAVPEIGRTVAEKYGDRTALIDRYHEPPFELTYKERVVLEPTIQGRDMIGHARTGTGKTLAFGIPIMYKITCHNSKNGVIT